MRTYLVAFVLASLVALTATPIVRRIAPKLGAVDLPSGRRVHKKVIPRLGGVAILAGFLAPLVGLYFFDGAVSGIFLADATRTATLIGGAIAVAVIGAIDDIRGLRAVPKLLLQASAAAATYAGGFRIEIITLPFLGDLDMGAFAAPITVFWIVGIVNAVNLMDGLDGLAAGVSFFVCIVSFVTGILSQNVLVCLLAVSLGGALLGFLFFNFNPATIFMGDTGSLTIGYILATISLLGTKGGTAVALLVPVLALGVPIMDTLLAIVRRMLERRPIFSPDKGHLHHRLLDLGLTHRRAVLAIYGISLLFTGSALVVYLGREWQIGLALTLVTVLAFAMTRLLGIVRLGKAAADRRALRYEPFVERLRSTVPRLLYDVKDVTSDSQLRDKLVAFAESSALTLLQLEGEGGDAEQPRVPPRWSWERKASAELEEQDAGYISARYSLSGGTDTERYVKFGWASEGQAVPAEAAILLQLATDAIRNALRTLAGSARDAD